MSVPYRSWFTNWIRRSASLITVGLSLMAGPMVGQENASTSSSPPIPDELAIFMLSRTLADGPEAPRYQGRMAFLTQKGFDRVLATKFLELMSAVSIAEKEVAAQFPDRGGPGYVQYRQRRNEQAKILYENFLKRIDAGSSEFVQKFLRTYKETNMRSRWVNR